MKSQLRPPGVDSIRSAALNVLMFLLAGLCCFGSGLGAESGGASGGGAAADEADRVRRTTERILASPEFRHLERRRQRSEQEKRDLRDSSGRGETGERGRQAGAREDPGDHRSDEGEEDAQRNQTDGADSERRSIFLPAGVEAVASAVGMLFHVVAWACLAVVAGLIVYLATRAVLDRERSAKLDGEATGDRLTGDEEPEHAPGELPADVYVAQARELAAAGRYREGVAQLLLGAMSQIERAGLVRYRRGLTHRDYLRAVRGRKETYRAMRSMVRAYEPIGFGRREATREHFETSLSGYEAGFHARSATMEK